MPTGTALIKVVAALTVASAADVPANTSTVTGKDGWLFFAPELRHLAEPRYADPVAAIVDFKEQLDQMGIELLLVPVPAKAAVYPEHLRAAAPPPGDLGQRAQREFQAQLARHGVKVLDLGPVFAEAKKKGSAPLYCRTDTHWSGHGCVVAAQSIAAELKRRPWYTSLAKRTLDSQPRSIAIAGDLTRGTSPVDKETVSLRLVGVRQGEGLVPVAPDRTSPIVLLGDSHNLVFHAGAELFSVGAGLPDQLAFELGMPVDLLAVRGSGATPARVGLARRGRADASYLKGKKVVIWCFTVRELTQSGGWQKVPLLGSKGGV